MRKTALSFAAALLATTAATPALADAEVFVEIDKTKDITVTENITITKEAVITVRMGTEADPFPLLGAAEASAYVNVTNTDNNHNVGQETDDRTFVPFGEGDAEFPVFDVRRSAHMAQSVNDNTGITGVNQDAGDMTNQANVVAVALILGSSEEFANSQAGTDQRNERNTVVAREELPDGVDNVLDQDPGAVDDAAWHVQSVMLNSVNENTGLVGVNQNSGNMNNQTNSLSLALGQDSVLSLAEGQLGQVNANNKVDAVETLRRDRMHASVNENTGAVQVNQSAGNMNNQASSMSFAASINGASAVGGFFQNP